MRQDTPYVIVPFVGGFLRPETRSLPNVELRNVGSSDQSYWELLVELWRGETFIVVEHDIVPTQEQLQEIWDCPEEWCSRPYRMGDIETTALGCTKFDSRLMRRMPDLVESILEQHRHWSGLDSMIVAGLHRRGAKEHEHLPAVLHLHEPTPPEPRRRELSKLHYVGTGRYLNGVPAADFETWDPDTIAICLESGLYTEAEPPRRRGRPPMSKMDEPDLITKFIPFSQANFSDGTVVSVTEVESVPNEEKES
jgi:hypothetical protein